METCCSVRCEHHRSLISIKSAVLQPDWLASPRWCSLWRPVQWSRYDVCLPWHRCLSVRMACSLPSESCGRCVIIRHMYVQWHSYDMRVLVQSLVALRLHDVLVPVVTGNSPRQVAVPILQDWLNLGYGVLPRSSSKPASSC